MTPSSEDLALSAFQRAATRVPAYKILLKETGVRPEEIRSIREFSRLPVLDKKSTFQRFRIEELCVDGETGPLSSVLTSSGHSGVFAFGLNPAGFETPAAQWADEILDMVFGVRKRRTLLINCLPMGVKVQTHACVLAETSVRPDMVIGLVKAFGSRFEQLILVGDVAFVKHVAETGERAGVDWKKRHVHVIAGEEILAENARIYLEKIFGNDLRRPEEGLIASSMGVAEFGLNLFSEAPPVAPLIVLRRALHQDIALRRKILGASDFVPSLFTYDPRRIFVEFDVTGRLILSAIDPDARVPLIRYVTGDFGSVLTPSPELETWAASVGIPRGTFSQFPIVAIRGRGDHALSGGTPVYPEAVKEGIYYDSELARLTTANFRLVSGSPLRIRIQLSPGIAADPGLEKRFAQAIRHYVNAPLEVSCEAYESFGSGMSLDYERKFAYLGS